MEKMKKGKNGLGAGSQRRWWAGPVAFMAAMLAAPASANFDIPDDPLNTAARVAPNILFILDDSGSMSFTEMYNPDISSVSGDSSVRARAYTTNTIYYNPAINYQSWVDAKGERLPGGMTYNSAYADFDRAQGGIDLSSSWSCSTRSQNGSNVNVCGGVQTYYVPKDTENTSVSYLGNANNYYRFQILTDGRVVRSERLGRSGSAPNYNNGPVLNSGCTSTANTTAWRNCTRVTPTGRGELEERNNYATWFSYHRTRMKAAKAGASEAFMPLDGSVRAGFRTIWGRNTFNIPVGDGNEGRFVDREDDPAVPGNDATNARSTWYARLHGATNGGTTPLHGALDSAGKYFSDSSATGPYGPQSPQYSCRQNFAILTTDGYWNNVGVDVGNQDDSSGSTIAGPNGQSYTYTPNAPYRDGHVNTLADVAMKYWKEDLRPGMTNNVPTTAANPAFWQHMVTFGISIGLKGNKPWTSVSEVPSDATWADPMDREDADRIDDLLHAAKNSRGAFVAATNPSEFTEGLSAALSAIAQRTSSYSNVATNSVSVDGGTRVFNASYLSGVWSGMVTARAITTGAETWTSSVPAFSQRQNQVFTFNGSAGARFPTTAQESALTRSGGPSNYAVSGDDNAKYLMGNNSLEERNGTGRLRNRQSLLGDIVHSSPAYVRDTDTLYVGANDGMLHAFDAEDGRELFAYVPNIINFSSLAELSRPDYGHKYFVDGPVAVSARTLTPDRNILIGSLGRGGKGLYALDVSSPESFASGDVKWERSETPDGNMGLVLGRPVIARVSTGDNAVIVSNGINSATGRAALIVLDLDDGSIIGEIDTGAGGENEPNGLSTPTAVFGSDGRSVAYVYAGDMLGNVWKFDLSDTDASAWSATRLFTAHDAGGQPQPITAGVAVATNPRTFERWIFFGTGRYLTTEDADPDSSGTQSMYGFVEPGEDAWSRSDLEEREIVEISDQLRGFQESEALPADRQGWVIDLPGPGERIVQDAQVASGYLITASMMPTGDACEADGTGFINAFDAFTGTSSGTSYFDLDGDGTTTDETIGDVPVGSYNPGIGMPTLSNLLRGRLVTGGSGGGEVREIATIRPRWDRVSWREIRGE